MKPIHKYLSTNPNAVFNKQIKYFVQNLPNMKTEQEIMDFFDNCKLFNRCRFRNDGGLTALAEDIKKESSSNKKLMYIYRNHEWLRFFRNGKIDENNPVFYIGFSYNGKVRFYDVEVIEDPKNIGTDTLVGYPIENCKIERDFTHYDENEFLAFFTDIITKCYKL